MIPKGMYCTAAAHALVTCLLAHGTAMPAHARVQAGGGRIRLSGPAGALTLSARNGSILAVTGAASSNSLLHSGEHGLWYIRFREGGELNAAAFGAAGRSFSWEAGRAGTTLTLRYGSPEADVRVAIVSRPDGFDFRAAVTPHSGTVLDFGLPARLRFRPETVRRLVCPANGNMGVGMAFGSAFFSEQPKDRPAGWRPQVAGAGGYAALYGGPLDQRPDLDPPVPLKVTAAGREWLGEPLAQQVEGARAVVNRPPTRAQADLVLADSINGPYFSASHLGGAGYLWRLGGGVGDEEKALALEMVLAVLKRLAASPPPGRTRVGLIAFPRAPERGGWANISISEWRAGLRRPGLLPDDQVTVAELTSPDAVMAALAADDYLAIINPYGEWAPVPPSGSMQDTVAGVRRYVRGGGNWFETGGYPFFYALTPLRYLQFATPYPAGLADFLHLDARTGSASLYRVQPMLPPWEGARRKAGIFVPGSLACGGDAQGGYLERSFATYVRPGETWRTPAVRLTLGRSAPEGLRAYCRANGITRRLAEKMPPALLHRFRRAVLVYYSGSARDKIAHLQQLPAPALVHFADYLKGGFDKEYPDHLPPNPRFGTEADLRAFFARCRQLGHLIMPYTNPTWWCDHPRGPTFLREGEAPLLKGLDGKPVYERYAANDGYTVCHWHPAVRAANERTVRQFTEDYPVDVLFQDQCGARGPQYDTNPASPTPYAYTEGLLSMVAQDCRKVPLSTEAGWDRVAQYAAQLCGLSWELVPTEGGPSWRTLMKEQVPPETWTVFPVAQYIAHDKAALLFHDLGQFVTNREVLAWALGLGFSLSYAIAAPALDNDAPREWLRWLDRLQQSVCARYVGEPVVSFTHDRGPAPSVEDDGVIRAQYGPVALIANLGPKARAERGRTLAPHGFLATAPGMVAANLQRLGGQDFGPEGAAFVAEKTGHGAEVWVYAPPQASVAVLLPGNLSGAVSLRLTDGPAPAASQPARLVARNGVLTFRLPDRPDRDRVAPPPALAQKPPLDWPGGPPAIGIIDLGPRVNPVWTRISPDEWVRAFAGSRLARELRVPVRRITSAAQLAEALQSGPTAWFAIINPYGEAFPALRPGRWQEVLESIRTYVNHGGCWWETAGYSFHSATRAEENGFQAEAVGPAGLAFFGVPIGGGAVDQPAEPLQVTPEGRAWLGADLAARVARSASAVNRGLPRSAQDPVHVALVAGSRDDFIGGYRLQGWGWLWRVGGFWPNPEVVLPVAVAAMEHLYAHPPLPVKPSRVRYLWHATVAPAKGAATNPPN